MHNEIKKKQAVSLRKAGYSLSRIAKMLQIAKSTSSIWVRDVEMKAPAKFRLDGRSVEGKTRGALERKRRLSIRYRVIDQSVKDDLADFIPSKTIKRLLCAFLYWGEGSKTRKDLRFINSDPKLIATFLTLFRGSFAIDELKLRARLHIHEYHDKNKQLIFWSKITKIPIYRISIYRKPNTGKRIREGYPGCISINYADSVIFTALTGYYRLLDMRAW